MPKTPETVSFSVSGKRDRKTAVCNRRNIPEPERGKQYGKHVNTDHNLYRTE